MTDVVAVTRQNFVVFTVQPMAFLITMLGFSLQKHNAFMKKKVGKQNLCPCPGWAPGRPFRLPEVDQAALQPPLPLQSFLPVQPCALVLQPPWPLQLLRPLQSCLAVEVSGDAATLPELSPELPPELPHPVKATVPATNPVMAAEIINAFAVLVIVIEFLSYQYFSLDCSMSETVNGRPFT
jgi:hypothetical protein